MERVADELEIRNVLARLAQLADDGATDDYISLLTDDIAWIMPANPAIGLPASERRGHIDVAAGQRDRMAGAYQGPGSNTMHMVATISVQFDDDDHAMSRSYFTYWGDTATDARGADHGPLRGRVRADCGRMEARAAPDHDGVTRDMSDHPVPLSAHTSRRSHQRDPGGYCGKVLADAGADVIRVPPAGVDPLGALGSEALFEFLHGSKRVGRREDDDGALDTGADVRPRRRRSAATTTTTTNRPADQIVVAITPFGLDGPWAERPSTEFTLQAAGGSTGFRGIPGEEPLAAGGRIGEWVDRHVRRPRGDRGAASSSKGARRRRRW